MLAATLKFIGSWYIPLMLNCHLELRKTLSFEPLPVERVATYAPSAQLSPV